MSAVNVPYGQPLPARGKGLCLLREVELVYVGKPVKAARVGSSRDVDALVRTLILDGPRETLVALFLDAKSKPTGWYRIAGALSSVVCNPADLLRPAIQANASSMVMAHNHPSGDPDPSSEDIALTDRMKTACDLIGIRLLDHVVIATDGYFSFLDAGMLKQ